MVNISKIPVSCAVHLGQAKLTQAEYQELRVGDVVLLDQSPTHSLSMTIEGHSLFKVIPGLEGVHKAVVILDA